MRMKNAICLIKLIVSAVTILPIDVVRTMLVKDVLQLLEYIFFRMVLKNRKELNQLKFLILLNLRGFSLLKYCKIECFKLFYIDQYHRYLKVTHKFLKKVCVFTGGHYLEVFLLKIINVLFKKLPLFTGGLYLEVILF